MNFSTQKQAAHLPLEATPVGRFGKPAPCNAFRAYKPQKIPQAAQPKVLGTLGTLGRAPCPFHPLQRSPRHD